MRAQGVLVIYLVAKVAAEEVLRKAYGVTQALNRRAQIARVIQVADPRQAHPRISIWFARLVPLLDHLNPLALLFVEAQVSGLALPTTVVDFVALAVVGQLVKLLAVAALRVDCQRDAATEVKCILVSIFLPHESIVTLLVGPRGLAIRGCEQKCRTLLAAAGAVLCDLDDQG